MVSYLRDQSDVGIFLVEQNFDFAFDLGDHFVTLTRGTVTHNAPRNQTEQGSLLSKVSVFTKTAGQSDLPFCKYRRSI